MFTTQKFTSLTFLGISLSLGLLFSSSYSAFAAGRVFYDGFEDGTTNAWTQNGTRNKCTVVTSAADGLTGVYAGTRMTRCNYNGLADWNTPQSFEVMDIDGYAGGGATELFLRAHVRRDANLVPSNNGSYTKILRQGDQGVIDMIDNIPPWDAFTNQIEGGGSGTYWGDAPGDNSNVLGHWATIERYFNASTGAVKVWHDDVLVRNDIINFGPLTNWEPLHITSNWADCQGPNPPDGANCDAINYVYFDEVEIFTNTGTGGTGSMSAGTITQGGSDITAPVAPTGLGVQ